MKRTHMLKDTALPLLTSLLLSVAATACMDEPDPSTDDAAAVAPVDDATPFTETVVHIAADGTRSTETRTITAGEERAQNAARERALRGEAQPLAVVTDPTCSGSSFWLYDRTDWTGNRICFAPDARPAGQWDYVIDLETVPRTWCVKDVCFRDTWALPSASYWGGQDYFRLITDGGSGIYIDQPYTKSYIIPAPPYRLTAIALRNHGQ